MVMKWVISSTEITSSQLTITYPHIPETWCWLRKLLAYGQILLLMGKCMLFSWIFVTYFQKDME